MGVWIRDIRERSGLNELQLRRTLKSLEGKKLVKSVKAVGTTKKSYVLYGIEADDSLTGGTFYSDQQLDSEFVQTLLQLCISMLQVSVVFHISL
jgi:DNA-directed RNA polymerase III subunit RPC6